MSTTATKPLTQEVAGAVKVPVFNSAGLRTGTVEVDAQELGGKINKQLLHDAVLMYRANQRAGTHSTKRRGEVAGSTRKLFRQKGTGNARVGTRRSNKRRGGGTAKGPKPRDYEFHLPKKAIRSATRMALLSKFRDGEALIIEDLKLDEIKTQTMAEILVNLDIDGLSLLIGLGQADMDEDQTIYKSARNIPLVEVTPAVQFNAYGLLRPQVLMLTRAALEELCPNMKWSTEVEQPPSTEEEEGAEAEQEEQEEE